MSLACDGRWNWLSEDEDKFLPNPPVGCVLANDGVILSEGWHDHLGDLHAEQAAIADAEAKSVATEGCVAYVTLEPCNHFGRTPPCTQALLWAGVEEVVVAARDPNPTVRGKGIQVLLDAESKSEKDCLNLKRNAKCNHSCIGVSANNRWSL